MATSVTCDEAHRLDPLDLSPVHQENPRQLSATRRHDEVWLKITGLEEDFRLPTDVIRPLVDLMIFAVGRYEDDQSRRWREGE